MKQIFDTVSIATSKMTTRLYSTSFSMGIHCLGKRFHGPIYSIYGFVRFADEIVDTFHDYNKEELINEFERDTYLAIERGISMNPILNSFQAVVCKYKISHQLIDCFLKSMKWDLSKNVHDEATYNEYIFGSAEVVGLMCLKVFTEGNDEMYQALTPSARKLGAAFQKVNFLRDMKDDYEFLGRIYFPGVDMKALSDSDKKNIEHDIEMDFADALEGIKRLPEGARFGIYVAFMYYRSLFAKIKSLPSAHIMMTRIRIPNYQKIALLCSSFFRHRLRLI